MNNLVLASSATEAASLEGACIRLADAARTVDSLSSNLITAARNPDAQELTAASQSALLEFIEQEILPLATALASAFQTAAGSVESLKVVAALTTVHNTKLASATRELRGRKVPAEMAQASDALQEAVIEFVDHASGLVLPALAQNAAFTLNELLPAHAGKRSRNSPFSSPHDGASGSHDEADLSELDTRNIPHSIRHATIFGKLDELATGRGILLVTSHNPLPLLAQLEQRAAGQFSVDYVANGPAVWKLSLVRI